MGFWVFFSIRLFLLLDFSKLSIELDFSRSRPSMTHAMMCIKLISLSSYISPKWIRISYNLIFDQNSSHNQERDRYSICTHGMCINNVCQWALNVNVVYIFPNYIYKMSICIPIKPIVDDHYIHLICSKLLVCYARENNNQVYFQSILYIVLNDTFKGLMYCVLQSLQI